MQRLPRQAGEAVEPDAPDLDRDDARSLGHDALDAQAVAQRADGREHDPAADERRHRRGVQRPPVGLGDGLALELVAGGELVAEPERDREVRADVQRVPDAVESRRRTATTEVATTTTSRPSATVASSTPE